MIEMDFEFDTGDRAEDDLIERLRATVRELAHTWENEAKDIITDGALDTGQFAASIHYELFEKGDEIGFTGMDGVEYGIHHEYGTISHFVPFYAWTGDGYDTSQPILADWGHRVLGLTEEEMLKQGGMMVEIEELRPFLRAMLHTQANAQKIFDKHFKGGTK